MKTIKILIPLLVLSLFGCSLSTSNGNQFPFKEPENSKNIKALSSIEIRNIIDLSVAWFKNIQEPDGNLIYLLSADSNMISKSNNMVRQAGAFYLISEVFKRDTNNVYDLDILIKNYSKYLLDNTIPGSYNYKNFYCLAENDTCSLGSSALALIGFVNYGRRNPSFYAENEKYIEGYKDYLLSMKIKDKGFISEYSNNKKILEEESPFFNGEAFLALSIYYINDQDEKILTVLLDSFDYFKNIYSKNYDPNFYLWGMLAIKELRYIIPSSEYLSFVDIYTKSRIKKFAINKNKNLNYCPYFEGISAASFLLKGQGTEEEQEVLTNELNFWMKKHKEMQIVGDEFDSIKIPNLRNALGAFVTAMDDLSLRIDYTQHCVNAYQIKYIDIDKNSY